MIAARIAAAIVIAAVTVGTGLSIEWVLGAILAIDLAQFSLVVNHRGRLATVEEVVNDA